MRNISTAFKNFLQGDALTIATCVLLTRTDGVKMGFTSCDHTLTIAGVAYESSNAITATAMKASTGTGVDNLDMIGLLKSDRIIEPDVLSGVYDGAAISMFQANWADLTMGVLVLLEGIVGEVRTRDGQFTAEIRSLGQRLTQQVGELCTPTCRVLRLGDSRCRVNIADYTFSGIIHSIESPVDITVQFSGAFNETYGTPYAYGIFRCTSGINAGKEKEIWDWTPPPTVALSLAKIAQFHLQEEFGYQPSIGDTVQVEQGCNRLLQTCITFYNNAINFRGEPSVPGSDAILAVGR